MRTVDFALDYVQKGWAIGPAHWIHNGACTCQKGRDCKNAGKHPQWHRELFPNGAHSATNDLVLVERLWRLWPYANIFVRTGHGLAVLDVDPRAGGDDALAELEAEHGELPDTPTVLTGGSGWHRHFATDEPLATCDLAPGLELKAGTGSLVIAPPSIHISGSRYEWEVASGPETPRAPLPEWMVTLAKSKAQEASQRSVGWAADWFRTPMAAATGRRGPQGLPRIVGYLRGHGIDCETAVAIIQLWDCQNVDPLGDDEVRRHVEGMYKRYGVHEPTRLHMVRAGSNALRGRRVVNG